MFSIPWFAGLYEGEGCLEHTSPKGYRLTIASTDYDVINKLENCLGGYTRVMKKYKPHHKEAWMWRLGTKASVYPLLEDMIPWLGLRRGYDAQNALDIMDGI